MAELIQYGVDGGIAMLTLHDPFVNIYSYEMMRELDRCIFDARMDESVYAIVVIGHGDKFFCVGADICMLNDVTSSFKYYFCLHANEMITWLENTLKLVIAALNGHTVGGGLEVALVCDIRLAKKGGGKIGLFEVSLGVLFGIGGMQCFCRLFGKSKVLELMAMGDTFDFDWVEQLGIVNRVFFAEKFMEQVYDFVGKFTFLNKASKVVGLIKCAVASGSEMSFAEGLALERELQQQLFMSSDAKEGIAVYVEKRKVSFIGK